MSSGMMLISVELLIMLIILLFVPGDYAGPCFIGFAMVPHAGFERRALRDAYGSARLAGKPRELLGVGGDQSVVRPPIG